MREARVLALVLNSGVLGDEVGGSGDEGEDAGKEFIEGERCMDRSD